jgi:hypothetical protein
LFIAAACLCGVALGGDKFTLPAPDAAHEQLIVFRPSALFAGAVSTKVLVDMQVLPLVEPCELRTIGPDEDAECEHL